MRCKACDVKLKDVRDRDVGDGIIITEDLCHKCRTIALFGQEDGDDEPYEVLEVIGVRAYSPEGF